LIEIGFQVESTTSGRRRSAPGGQRIRSTDATMSGHSCSRVNALWQMSEFLAGHSAVSLLALIS
jgi:hypothetical protein